MQRLIADHFDEAADYVEVLRRLWDSWEDDAEIRDVATGRFIDRDKLHYIDFEGRWFSVKGPSITPRPPQGQPIVAALGHAGVPYQLIARSADVGFVTPRDAAHAAEIVTQIRAEQARAGRAAQTLHVFGDLVVFLDASEVFLEGTPGARFHHDGTNGRISGPAPDDASYGSFVSFSDPDGSSWLLQEVTTRLPGRVDHAATSFASVSDLADAMRRASAAHGEHEKRIGAADANWPDWYAQYMVAEQAGTKLPT